MEKLIKLAYLFGIISVAAGFFLPTPLWIAISFISIYVSLLSVLVYKNRRAITVVIVNFLLTIGTGYYLYKLLFSYSL